MITGYCFDYFLSDRANDADRLIHLAESQGSKIVIPPKSIRIDQRECDRHIYKERHLVERFLLNSKYSAGFQHVMKNWLKFIGQLF
jgi:transposase